LPAYEPHEYTDQALKGKPFADKELNEFKPVWYEVDNGVDRRSFTGRYAINEQTGRPVNPMGRTGIMVSQHFFCLKYCILQGRGRLGRWGPNHAADPIVTRWKREKNNVVKVDGKPVLQFVSILRGDVRKWALPGGRVKRVMRFDEFLWIFI
jgi:hypothetical protein